MKVPASWPPLTVWLYSITICEREFLASYRNGMEWKSPSSLFDWINYLTRLVSDSTSRYRRVAGLMDRVIGINTNASFSFKFLEKRVKIAGSDNLDFYMTHNSDTIPCHLLSSQPLPGKVFERHLVFCQVWIFLWTLVAPRRSGRWSCWIQQDLLQLQQFQNIIMLSLVLTNSLFLRVKSCNRWIQASEPLMDRIGSTRDRRALSLEQSAHNPLLSPQDLQTRSPLVWGGRQVGALPGRGSGWSPTAEDLLQEEAGPFQERGVGAVAWGKAFCRKPVQGTNWVSAERAASRHCGAIGESWWVSSTGRFPPLDPDTGRHSKHGANLLF